MEISRLTFTKETQEKMEKGLSKRQRGKLRYQKLVEIANNGRLSIAKNRREVARLVGYMPGQEHSGYSWVTNMINRGHLKETVVGSGRHGYLEYEYTLGSNKPRYDLGPISGSIKQETMAVKTNTNISGATMVIT